MTQVKKKSRNAVYEEKQRAKGLEKVTVWVPGCSADELKIMAEIMKEFYLEEGEHHKELVPYMYRDLNTGVMGNKTLSEHKRMMAKKAAKEQEKNDE